MKTSRWRPRAALAGSVVPLLVALVGGGCNTPPEGTRDWTAADHDQADNATGARTSGVVAPGEEEATLIAVTWRKNCARCHGVDGRSQVPEGRMLRAPDLTRPALQQVDDAIVANVISKGRNKMPAFALPPKVLRGLVAHIRTLQNKPR